MKAGQDDPVQVVILRCMNFLCWRVRHIDISPDNILTIVFQQLNIFLDPLKFMPATSGPLFAIKARQMPLFFINYSFQGGLSWQYKNRFLAFLFPPSL
jgi:hypothetical protein